jgi:3-oxoacyl-[acyl-carrier-protein] synthase II
MNTTRVAITGIGLLTGLGLNTRDSWKGLLAGRCPIKRFSTFDPQGLAAPFGVELPDGAEELFVTHLKPRHRKQMTRGTKITAVAAKMAAEDANLEYGELDKTRVGVVLGATGTGYAPTSQDTDRHRIIRNMASAPAAWVSLGGKYMGPSYVVSTACSSGAFALHSATMLIASGQCDVVISGSADSAVNYLDVEGFCSLMALSEDIDNMTTASRPFDKNRGGFVMGEGGGILVLEGLEFAKRRRAKVYAEMSLPGLNSEAYNIMSPRPDGESIAVSMKKALENAGLDITDIDYINAHGTSTELNDRCETKAIKSVFGQRAYDIPVSSTKSMTGHCLSGASGVEAAICCKVIEQGKIPPTVNLQEPDPELDLDYVPGRARQKDVKNAMTNSFAFGGHNGVCIFSKPL